MISLEAQISALRVVVERATPNSLVRGGFCFRLNEGGLFKERLAAALATLEKQRTER